MHAKRANLYDEVLARMSAARPWRRIRIVPHISAVGIHLLPWRKSAAVGNSKTPSTRCKGKGWFRGNNLHSQASLRSNILHLFPVVRVLSVRLFELCHLCGWFLRPDWLFSSSSTSRKLGPSWVMANWLGEDNQHTKCRYLARTHVKQTIVHMPFCSGVF